MGRTEPFEQIARTIGKLCACVRRYMLVLGHRVSKYVLWTLGMCWNLEHSFGLAGQIFSSGVPRKIRMMTLALRIFVLSRQPRNSAAAVAASESPQFVPRRRRRLSHEFCCIGTAAALQPSVLRRRFDPKEVAAAVHDVFVHRASARVVHVEVCKVLCRRRRRHFSAPAAANGISKYDARAHG